MNAPANPKRNISPEAASTHTSPATLGPNVAASVEVAQSLESTDEHAAIHALADLAMAPVQELMAGHDWFLRIAMMLQVGVTIVVTWIAWQAALPDWQVYGLAGLCALILVGNSMRWPVEAGFVRRLSATLVALLTSGTWGLLLFDRARSANWLDQNGRVVPFPQWFWLPVILLAGSGALLIVHLFGAPREVRIAQQIKQLPSSEP